MKDLRFRSFLQTTRIPEVSLLPHPIHEFGVHVLLLSKCFSVIYEAVLAFGNTSLSLEEGLLHRDSFF